MRHAFGIIGLGSIAELHAKAIHDIENADLIACFDIHKERASQFCSKYGGVPYDTLSDFLNVKELEIVTICTPSGLHMESALLAAQAKKHLIIEKPLDITIQRCDAIIAASEEHGVCVSGIFPSRFYQVSQVVKKAIEEGRLGNIVLGDAYVKWYRSQSYYDASGWKGTWKLDGGGTLMNQSIHAIDLLQWFMGPVIQVSAFTGTIAHQHIEVEDTAVGILRFSSGALGVIEGTTGAYPGCFKKIEIQGNMGSIVLEEENLTTWSFVEERKEDQHIRKTFSGHHTSGGGVADPTSIGYLGHKLQLDRKSVV